MSQPNRIALTGEARAWTLLLALARRASEGQPVTGEVGLRVDERGALEEADGEDAWVVANPRAERGWCWPAAGDESPAVETMLDLYMPLCLGAGAAELVVGHLGQSLDGRIATESGDSQFITSDENLVHMHRLRALSDVVLVGSRTVREDDPQLTTRLVPGPSPVRAIVDPLRRLGAEYRVFSDGRAPTLLFCAAGAALETAQHGQAEVVATPGSESLLAVQAILTELKRRGLKRVFVEGGGVTVSRFLEARALSRLQIAVAPLVLGSGRPTLSLPAIADLSGALALECRHFAMGRDILFDCVLP
jgi:riboflavin-specific deaminase-like protein